MLLYKSVEIVALTRGARPGLYHVALSPPRCGVVKTRLMELPTNIEPPFRAWLLKTKHGSLLVNIRRINIDSFILENLENVIEGEINNGLLEGVVCNKKIETRVLNTNLEGPVLAVLPVTREIRKFPRLVFNLLVYSLKLV